MPVMRGNGIQIGYAVHGAGAPLVLISGLGYDRWQWHRMVPGLATRFQVITFDNRGVGQSDAPPGPYSARLLADDTAALLAGLNIPRAAVMGHSMGGFVAQELALSYPALVDRLILAATNFGGPRHVPITPEAMAVLSDVTADPVTRFQNGLAVSTAAGFARREPEMIADWLAWRERHPVAPEAYQAQLAVGLSLLAADASFEPRLPRIAAPTLVLHGAEDRVVPPGNARLLAERIPHSRVKILPGAGHFFPIETPAAANAAITGFLQQAEEGL